MIKIKDTWDKVTDPKMRQLAALSLQESNISPDGDVYIYPFNDVYHSTQIKLGTLFKEIFGQEIRLNVHDNPNDELAEKIRDLIRSVPIPNVFLGHQGKSFEQLTSHMVLREDWRQGEAFNDLIKKLGVNQDKEDEDGFFITTEHHLRLAGYIIDDEKGTASPPTPEAPTM